MSAETADVPSPKRRRGPRQDVARNKAAIIEATGELLLDDPERATMPAIAERAGLHVATVYRYFPTLDQLHREYLLDVQRQLVAYAESRTLEGVDLFEAVLGKWIELVIDYGPAMVLIRSREGFLARKRRGDEHARVLEAAWGRPVRELMRLEGVDEKHYDYALALRNAMFNSRELLDIVGETKRSPARLVQELTAIYRSAIRGLIGTSIL